MYITSECSFWTVRPAFSTHCIAKPQFWRWMNIFPINFCNHKQASSFNCRTAQMKPVSGCSTFLILRHGHDLERHNRRLRSCGYHLQANCPPLWKAATLPCSYYHCSTWKGKGQAHAPASPLSGRREKGWAGWGGDATMYVEKCTKIGLVSNLGFSRGLANACPCSWLWLLPLGWCCYPYLGRKTGQHPCCTVPSALEGKQAWMHCFFIGASMPPPPTHTPHLCAKNSLAITEEDSV